MDNATGLLYVGNGQYYDPATGRFLNRNARPEQTNPYVPWSSDPTGALFSPLLLLAMVFGNKKKRGKYDQLMIILVIGVLLFMSLSCAIVDIISQGVQGIIDAVNSLIRPPGSPNYPGGGTEPGMPPDPTVPPVINPKTPCPGDGDGNGDGDGIGDGDGDGGFPPQPPPPPPTIKEELMKYGVTLTGTMGAWTSYRQDIILKAVKVVANRFTGVIGGSPEDVFISVYENFSFDWDPVNVTGGYGWTYSDDMIKIDDMYEVEQQAIRFVIHELGHLFDRKVCASRNSEGVCMGDEIFNNSARSDMELVWNTQYCGIYLCLGRPSHDGPHTGMFYGFAGGFEDWQFSAPDPSTIYCSGEVWADMFIGWVFDKWNNDSLGFGIAKRAYIDKNMTIYLAKLSE